MSLPLARSDSLENLRLAWLELRSCATNEEAVSRWIVDNGRSLILKAHQLESAHAHGISRRASGSITAAGFVQMISKPFDAESLKTPVLTLYLQMHAPERHFLSGLFKHFGMVAETRSYDFMYDGFTRAVSLGFDAREWPFAAAYMLKKHLEIPESRGPQCERIANLKSILSEQFPHLTWDSYLSAAPGVLAIIDSDATVFRSWLNQYCHSAQQIVAPSLPEDLSP